MMAYKSSVHFAVLALFIWSQIMVAVVNSATQSILTDKEALLSFKSLVNTDPSNTLSSWDRATSPCNWTHVACDEARQRVTDLDLSDLGLTGSISPQIGNLSFLRSLQLQENQLTGTIPDLIGSLSHLRIFNVSFNSIKGPIPSNITMCVNLTILDLTRNEMSGSIPEDLSRLSNLEVLNLGQNGLVGVIPPSIANLTSLLTLNLATNAIGGTIPGDLGRLQNLRHLDLSINGFTGTVPPSLYNISSLVHFALASNRLWGRIPSDVGDRLPKLLHFNFCINKFTGPIPGSLHNLTNIRLIRMADNLLDGSVPPGLENLAKIEMYNIGFNQITSSGDDGLNFISSLTNSTHLKFLAIDGNLLEGVIPESTGNLSTSLTHLYMGGNRIHGKIPVSISRLSSLALLNLSHNLISGEIPPEIGQLEQLKALCLAGNKLSGAIPDTLGNLQILNEIDLSANALIGRIPSTFVNFRALLSMDLSNNRLNWSIPKEISGLSGLATLLNLSNNLLTGPLPEEVGRLENVVTIDLSDNHLTGSIPNSIGNCKSLEELFLANNSFSGFIPDALGELKGLEVLDLSLNQLSGPIPSSLQNLHALQVLNLSFNELQGIVPTGGVFNNSSGIDLEGNSELCLNLACKENGGDKNRFTKVHIIVITTASIAICFAIGLLLCVRKRMVKIMHGSDSLRVQHQQISYNELRIATGGFNKENLIGNGSFGSVYKGHLREGIVVAVKVFDIFRNSTWKSFLAECEALRNVRHRNLVKLITSCSSIDFTGAEFLALVYEFMSNGSLDDWIRGRRMHSNGFPFNMVERLDVAIGVASAMDYLHNGCETPIVHCDLKPSNVLLDEDMTVKVADFGLASLLLEGSSDKISITLTDGLRGSIGYIPPEYGMGVKPSTAGDVYSYGVMLLELFTGKSPTHESFSGELSLVNWVRSAFPGHVEQVMDQKLLLVKDDCIHQCLVTVVGIGLSCTVESPDGRATMRDVLLKLKAARDGLVNGTIGQR